LFAPDPVSRPTSKAKDKPLSQHKSPPVATVSKAPSERFRSCSKSRSGVNRSGSSSDSDSGSSDESFSEDFDSDSSSCSLVPLTGKRIRLDQAKGSWDTENSRYVVRAVVRRIKLWDVAPIADKIEKEGLVEESPTWIFHAVLLSVMSVRLLIGRNNTFLIERKETMTPEALGLHDLYHVAAMDGKVEHANLTIPPADQRLGPEWDLVNCTAIIQYILAQPQPWKAANLTEGIIRTKRVHGDPGFIFCVVSHVLTTLQQFLQKNLYLWGKKRYREQRGEYYLHPDLTDCILNATCLAATRVAEISE